MPDTTRDMLMCKIMLFEPVMQQFYLKNKFFCKFHRIATIQPGSPSEFFVKTLRYCTLTNLISVS